MFAGRRVDGIPVLISEESSSCLLAIDRRTPTAPRSEVPRRIIIDIMSGPERAEEVENFTEQEVRKTDGGFHPITDLEIVFATQEASQDVEKMETDDKLDASRVENAADTDTADSVTLEGSEGSQRKDRWATVRTTYHFLSWTPKSCRYDPESPPKFTLTMNFLFAFVSLNVSLMLASLAANPLGYNHHRCELVLQPVNFEQNGRDVQCQLRASIFSGHLDAGRICVGASPDLPFGRHIPSTTVYPASNSVHRDIGSFILTLGWLELIRIGQWIALCTTNSFNVFAGISFICGMTTVTPQLMLPLVGDLAPPERRASSLAVVVSGLSLGMLIARLLSGIIANYTDWRNIYWFAFAAQYLVFFLLFFFMPDYPSKNPDGLNYFRIMWSIVQLLFTEPVLVQACLISFLSSAVFTSYWTTLSFLLSSPPYSYSSLTIGLFSLIGIFIICWGPVYSRIIIDKIQPLYSSVIGLTIELAGVIVGTFIGDFTVAGPVIQAVVIDLGNQACNIANRTAIYHIQPKARNRVNTCYMLAAFCGQLTGTAVGNRLYAQGGWKWSGSCSSKSRVQQRVFA